MTKTTIRKKGESTIKALKEYNGAVLKASPSKREIEKRLESESKSSVDIEYPGEDLYGLAS